MGEGEFTFLTKIPSRVTHECSYDVLPKCFCPRRSGQMGMEILPVRVPRWIIPQRGTFANPLKDLCITELVILQVVSTKNRSFISDHLEWWFFMTGQAQMDTVTSVKEFPPSLSTLLSVGLWGKSNRLLIKRSGFGSNRNHLCPSRDGWSEKKHFTPQHKFLLLHLDFGIWILLQRGTVIFLIVNNCVYWWCYLSYYLSSILKECCFWHSEYDYAF